MDKWPSPPELPPLMTDRELPENCHSFDSGDRPLTRPTLCSDIDRRMSCKRRCKLDPNAGRDEDQEMARGRTRPDRFRRHVDHDFGVPMLQLSNNPAGLPGGEYCYASSVSA